MITSESELPQEAVDPAFVILDVTDPEKITFVDRIRTSGTTISFASQGGLLFCNEIGNLEIFDVSKLPQISLVSRFAGTDPGNTIIYEKNEKRLYLSSYQHGISIVDVKNLNSPAILGRCDCDNVPETGAAIGPYGISQIEKRGHYVFGVAMDYMPKKSREALYVYDVSDVAAPVKAARLSTTPVKCHGMAIGGNYAFVAGTHGILSVDISVPEEPAPIGELASESRFAAYAVRDHNRLFVSGGTLSTLPNRQPHNGFFQMIDIANPVHPRLASEIPIPIGCVFGFSVKKGFAYLACSNGVAIVDVHDTGKQVIVSQYYDFDPTKKYIGAAVVEVD